MSKIDLEVMHIQEGQGELIAFNGVELMWKVTSEMSRGAIVSFIQINPPGLGVPMHIHHRDEENIYLLEGELSFQLDERKFTVRPGDIVNMPRGTPHGFSTIGSVPSKVLFTLDLSPGADYETMFDRLTRLDPDDQEGMLRATAENDVEFLTPLTLP